MKNKKRVGVITFHSAHNYGAILQCLGLQKILQKFNYENYVINYRNKVIDKPFRIINFNNSSVKMFIRSIFVNLVLLKKNIVRHYKFEKFINKQFNLSKKYTNEKQLKNSPPLYDCYIAGSDQIWSYKLVGTLEDSYTLNFGDEKTKRIIYAASLDDYNIILKNKESFKNKLSIVDKISVREEKIKNELSKIISKKITVTLDPAILLSSKEWNAIIEKKIMKKNFKKYIFAYALGDRPEHVKVVNYLSNITGYKVIHVEKRNKYKNILKNAYECDPYEFINYIKNAEYIITTSFHATVFSIIYNKKFWCVPPNEAGGRITNLLSLLKIDNRIVYSLQEFIEKNYDEKINYKEVNTILENERNKSIKWLIDSIEK